MASSNSKYQKHILVCIKERPDGHPRGCCFEHGGMEIRTRFVQLINQHGLKGKVRATKSGCLDICELGPNVVIYPQDIWYTSVTIDDVEEIFTTSVLNNQTVERLVASDETWIKWKNMREKSTQILKELK